MQDRTAAPAWKAHEHEVAIVYRALGFKVTHDINLAGQQADLVCERAIPGAGEAVLYVDCKHTRDGRKSSITKDDVVLFAAQFGAVKRGFSRFTKGVLVSNRPFTQFAKAAANANPEIVLKTISELYEDLFQIEPYLERSLRDADVVDDYVRLNGRSYQSESDGSRFDLAARVSSWLSESNSSLLTLIGDFGAGKTTFVRRLYAQMARRFLDKRDGRIPLFISLKDYFDSQSGPELVEHFFANELSARVPWSLFQAFSTEGQFLIIFDGFDEMGAVSDTAIRKRNFTTLAQIAVGDCKAVLTCRPSYFVGRTEMVEILRSYERHVGPFVPSHAAQTDHSKAMRDVALALQRMSRRRVPVGSTVRLKDQVRNVPIITVEPFDQDQIRQYLGMHRAQIITASNGTLDDHSTFQRMEQIYDLSDLATRPILLKLIVQTLPRFRQTSQGGYEFDVGGERLKFRAITPSVLYFAYTEEMLATEYLKGRIRWELGRDIRRAIIAEIAHLMLRERRLYVDDADLGDILRRHVTKSSDAHERFVNDVRTCSFLSFDKNDSLRFVHKSFMEYYAAQHIAHLLDYSKQATDALGERLLPEEVTYFLGDTLNALKPGPLVFLNGLVEHKLSTETAVCNGLNILNSAQMPRRLISGRTIPSLLYNKLLLEDIALNECTITEVRWRASRVKSIRLERSAVVACGIYDTQVASLELAEGTSATVLLERASGTMSIERSNAALQIVSTKLSELKGVTSVLQFDRTRDSEIGRVYVIDCVVRAKSDAKGGVECGERIFSRCIFLDCDLDGALFYGATFKECVFVACKTSRIKNLLLDDCRGFMTSGGRHGTALRSGVRVWTTDQMTRELKQFRGRSGEHQEVVRKRREAYLDKASWEEALLAASDNFRLTNTATVSEAKGLVSGCQAGALWKRPRASA
jgi:NACHT domain/Restriction endonuclease